FTSADQAQQIQENAPYILVARIEGPTPGVLYDALGDSKFCSAILDAIANNQRIEADVQGEIRATAFPSFAALRGPADVPLVPALGKAEQSNTSILYGNQLILKVFRRLEEGMNPDLEISYYLTQKMSFPHTAPLAGAIEYRRGRRAEPMSLAILQGFVPNQ